MSSALHEARTSRLTLSYVKADLFAWLDRAAPSPSWTKDFRVEGAETLLSRAFLEPEFRKPFNLNPADALIKDQPRYNPNHNKKAAQRPPKTEAPAKPTKTSPFTPVDGAEDRWFYIDNDQVVQGPFPGEYMEEWFEQGYLNEDLLLKNGDKGTFVKLSELIHRLEARKNNRTNQFTAPTGPRFTLPEMPKPAQQGNNNREIARGAGQNALFRRGNHAEEPSNELRRENRGFLSHRESRQEEAPRAASKEFTRANEPIRRPEPPQNTSFQIDPRRAVTEEGDFESSDDENRHHPEETKVQQAPKNTVEYEPKKKKIKNFKKLFVEKTISEPAPREAAPKESIREPIEDPPELVPAHSAGQLEGNDSEFVKVEREKRKPKDKKPYIAGWRVKDDSQMPPPSQAKPVEEPQRDLKKKPKGLAYAVKQPSAKATQASWDENFSSSLSKGSEQPPAETQGFPSLAEGATSKRKTPAPVPVYMKKPLAEKKTTWSEEDLLSKQGAPGQSPVKNEDFPSLT